MSIDITWKITRLEVVNKEGLSNVAIQACFDVSGVDEVDHRGFAQGDVLLGAPNPQDFTNINDVTEEQAMGWVKSALGDRVAFFENSVIQQINWQKQPKPHDVDLPWMNSNS